MGATKKGIAAGRKGFCAERKPGHPGAYDLRVLNHEQRTSDLLQEENDGLRAEIERLNAKAEKLCRDVRKLMEK